MKRYVLYHSSCYDGFGSAFAAWKHFHSKGIPAEYLPVSYGHAPPEMNKPSVIYIVDFSYDEKTLCELRQKYNCEIVVLDHHKTAKEKLEGIIEKYDWLTIIFTMNKSGALITWDYFHTEPAPMLIRHISDRDLWRFELPGSAEVHKALVSYPMDFELWDTFEGRLDELKTEGKALSRMYTNLVDNICKHPFKRKIDGHEVPVVNTTIAWSEVGEKLLKMFPEAPFVASFTVFDDQVMWSLRSRLSFDVSEVAKKFGGGGHAQAAGFKTSRY